MLLFTTVFQLPEPQFPGLTWGPLQPLPLEHPLLPRKPPGRALPETPGTEATLAFELILVSALRNLFPDAQVCEIPST